MRLDLLVLAFGFTRFLAPEVNCQGSREQDAEKRIAAGGISAIRSRSPQLPALRDCRALAVFSVEPLTCELRSHRVTPRSLFGAIVLSRSLRSRYEDLYQQD